MNYQAVIFDLDGVICSTDELHYRAWKQLADRMGIPFDRRVNDRLRGVSRAESLEILLACGPANTLTALEKAELANEKNALYRASLQTLTPRSILPGAEGVLEVLHRAHVRLAIGSSSKNTPLILEKLGLAGRFDAVSDGNAITRSKPDPEVFLHAAEMLQLPPADCLVVEDAPAGAEAAHRGGMKAACVGPAAAERAGDYNLLSLEELPALVLGQAEN